jgi:hypothetical protein
VQLASQALLAPLAAPVQLAASVLEASLPLVLSHALLARPALLLPQARPTVCVQLAMALPLMAAPRHASCAPPARILMASLWVLASLVVALGSLARLAPSRCLTAAALLAMVAAGVLSALPALMA